MKVTAVLAGLDTPSKVWIAEIVYSVLAESGEDGVPLQFPLSFTVVVKTVTAGVTAVFLTTTVAPEAPVPEIVGLNATAVAPSVGAEITGAAGIVSDHVNVPPLTVT